MSLATDDINDLKQTYDRLHERWLLVKGIKDMAKEIHEADKWFAEQNFMIQDGMTIPTFTSALKYVTESK